MSNVDPSTLVSDEAAVEDIFARESEKISRELKEKRPNILVLGGTGVGKSSLVNLVFGREVAKVGEGRPVTEGINKYPHDLVTVFDSEGYESGSEKQKRFSNLVETFIEERKRSADEALHLVWYCVSLPGARFTDLDSEIIKKIIGFNIPVAVVLTKVDSGSKEQTQAMQDEIRRSCPSVDIFKTSTDQRAKGHPEYDVTNLVDWSYKELPEAYRRAFVTASTIAIKQKIEEGKNIVLTHVGIAAGFGAIPIPFADAIPLTANQVTMIARLASLWDIMELRTMGGALVSSGVTTALGKSLVSSALKLIPGVGTVIGSAISATVAAGLTAGQGYGANKLCEIYSVDKLEGKNTSLAVLASTPEVINAIKSAVSQNK